MVGGNLLASPFYFFLPSATSVLPNKVTWLSEEFLATPFRRLRNAIAGLFPPVYTAFEHGLKLKINWTFILVGSSLEEVAFRGCLQSVLLTEAPKLILRKIAPSHEHLVNHKIAKIARIVFTSLLFALVHIARFADMPGMLLPQFLAGVVFSFLRERGTSLTELSLIHCINNVVVISLCGGIHGGTPASYV